MDSLKPQTASMGHSLKQGRSHANLRHVFSISSALMTGMWLWCAPSAMAQTPQTTEQVQFAADTNLEIVLQHCADRQIIQVDGMYQCPITQAPIIAPSSAIETGASDTGPNVTGTSLGNTPTSHTSTMMKIVTDMQEFDLAHDPILAGSKGDQDALSHLPDASTKARDQNIRFSRALQERYKKLSAANLYGENLLNYQLLGYVLEQRLAFTRFDTARLDFTNDSGFFNMLSYVTRQTRFETPDDYRAFAARLSELPRYFAQHKTNMRRGVKTGYTASGEILPGIIGSIRALSGFDMSKDQKPNVLLATDEAVKSHPFFLPFTQIPDRFDDKTKSEITALGESAFTKSVLPAYRDLLAFFEQEYAPAARKTVGIGTNAQNREYYKALVKHFTTLDLTPDQVHEMGLSEVTRIRAEMDAVIIKTGFEGDFKAFLNFLRTDPQFYAKTPEELLKTAAWIAKKIDGEMPKFFGQLPRLPYGVMAVPDEIAANYTTGRYWGGNPTTGLAGYYVVNTYNLPQRPLYNLPALTLHEAVPGHHQQIALAQELKNVPEYRKELYPNAFGEGWGLYAEKLGVEMGIYETDYENFGRLTYEMWRACRLVVDTGMHWKGWSREQAEQCFFENTALAPHNIKTEVERYISWPGQALAYKIGELKILELRARAEKALGADFDIRGFHDEVLGHGGIPLNILEEQIDNWIVRRQNP